jgi:hypothetical protein
MVPQHRGGTLKTTKTAFKYISRVTLLVANSAKPFH